MKKSIRYPRWATLSLVGYLFFLMWLLLFIDMPPFGRTTFRYDDVAMQLVPLKSLRHYLGNSLTYGFSLSIADPTIANVLGNVALFLPLGILLPLNLPRLNRQGRLVLIVFLISLTAEVIQRSLGVGVFDVDDILLNTLGGLLGYGLLRGWQRLATRQ